MKTITCWDDLVPYGIERLTGEACAYGMRQLCDVSERGAAIIREFMGLPSGSPLAKNWNSGRSSPTGPSVGSVMLGNCRSELAVFCLMADGAATVVVRPDGDVVGFYPSDACDEESLRYLEYLRKYRKIERSYTSNGGPRVGSRMEHQCTGRVA